MKQIHILLAGCAILLSMSCSTKKNKTINRKYHEITAQYNAIFNGEEALKEGKLGLIESYKDDFWEILPVERIHLPDPNEDEIGYESNPTLFDRAEEKAIVAIQKHGMYIDGKERNKKMAEAYLLLGKARYYEGRFIPAIDAFNFILTRYPSSKSINEANIWRAKTYVRLENEEVAIELLKRTLDDADLDDNTAADASIMIAQAYVQMDSIPEALPYVKLAAEKIKDNEKKGRYQYIQGQLYNLLKEPDSANIAFEKVIKLHRRTLRDYYVHAHLEKMKNTSYTTVEEKEELDKFINKFEKDRENRPYLDHIYHHIALYHHKEDSLKLAESYYNKSIQAYNEDGKLQSINYNTLAEMFFDKALYKEAGAYYDSTLTFMQENTLTFRRTKKKRDNLEDVIKYEGIAQQTDSIIELTKMSESEQLDFFTAYTDKLKEKAIADSIAQARVEQRLQSGSASFGNRQSQEQGTKFYFYNTTQAAFGKQEFELIWGNRRLEDNWRWSNKRGISDFDEEEENLIAGGASILDDERFNPQAYIDAIPKNEETIDSIIGQRDFAYYQLGLIYKEKFKENSLAINRLEKLLENKPEERLILPAQYHLYRIYEEENNIAEMNRMKNKILNEYPDSRYAQIITDPQSISEDNNSPEAHYNQTYALYEIGEYEEALKTTEDYIERYTGEEIAPKFELLKASLLGKIEGYESYGDALNYVALNYPNSPEGKQAEKIYSKDLQKLAFTNFISDEDAKRWKLIYSFSTSQKQEAIELQEILQEILEDLEYANLKVSVDYYNPELTFVVIHGLRSRLGATGLSERLQEYEENPIENLAFEISSRNYAIILIHKNLEEYLVQDLK